ncbi:MAG: glycine cleavage system protein H [Proteobacteria bacterium]|nr:glycine cleavage system protein H [Pseudomonadota bacterium]
MTGNNNSKRSSANIIQGFPVRDNECIWMKAGLVDFRLCDNAFDCSTCPFDTGMQKKMKKAGAPSPSTPKSQMGEGLFYRYRKGDLPCRHFLTGRIEVMKQCPNNYECHHCEYDQWLDAYDETCNLTSSGQFMGNGFNVADDCYYHIGHMWAHFEHGGQVCVGCDDFLASRLDPFQKINIPALGAKVTQGEPCLYVYFDHKQIDLVSPVTGTVLKINPLIATHPHLLKDDPYGKGWLLLIAPDMPRKNLKSLMTREEMIKRMAGDPEIQNGEFNRKQ